MKKFTSRVVIALLVCMLASVAVSAKVRSQTITFGKDFIVGATTVKSGTYRVSFDDQTKELTITDRKTKQVVAKATASVEKRQKSGSLLDVQVSAKGDALVLDSIAFNGDDQVVRLAGSGSATASVQ